MIETFGVPFGEGTRKELSFLILLVPSKEIMSVTLREGQDFLDEDLALEFGEFYVLETAD